MDALNIIWAIPLLFFIHEIEEWNILKWYKKYYNNLPPSSDFSIHIHIFAFGIAGFLLTTLAYFLHDTFVFSFIICFISAFILLNVFQHIVWTFQLKAYSPGLITGLILLVSTALVNAKLISSGNIQLLFYLITLFTIIPGIKTLKIRNEMTPEIRQVHKFFIAVEKRLRKS